MSLRLPAYWSLSALAHLALLCALVSSRPAALPADEPIEVSFRLSPREQPRASVSKTRAPRAASREQAVRTASVAPPATTSSPIAEESPGVLSDYLGSIAQLIESRKQYPPSAQRRGQQGKVTVRLRLGRDGEILDLSIAEPSPYEALNVASLSVIRSIGVFPPIPFRARSELTLHIPVEYKLWATP